MNKSRPLELRRFKRSPQGLIQFAILLEQTTPTKRNEILKLVQLQDQGFYEDVLKKTVFFEELVLLEDGIIAEILFSTPPKVLAYALLDAPPDMRKKLENQMGFRELRIVKDEEEKIGTNCPLWLISGARKRILIIARDLEKKQKFTLEIVKKPARPSLKEGGTSATSPS